MAKQDLTAQIRGLAANGLSPRELGELTPHQLFTVLFEERRDPPSGDPLDTLAEINAERDEKGERPALPHWWANHLPRKPKPQPPRTSA